MRAIAIRNGKGSADALYLEDDRPDPVPLGDQILVCIRAFGLNRLDTMQREDRDPYTSLDKGSVLGVEFSGIVEKKGPDCMIPSLRQDMNISRHNDIQAQNSSALRMGFLDWFLVEQYVLYFNICL